MQPKDARPHSVQYFLIPCSFCEKVAKIIGWPSHLWSWRSLLEIPDPPLKGCARFVDFLQNFSERQILWILCSVVFHAFTLKMPI